MARYADELLAQFLLQSRATAMPPRRTIARLGTLFRQWRQRSRDRQAAAQLTERALQDMGLTRADLYRELYSWRRR